MYIGFSKIVKINIEVKDILHFFGENIRSLKTSGIMAGGNFYLFSTWYI